MIERLCFFKLKRINDQHSGMSKPRRVLKKEQITGACAILTLGLEAAVMMPVTMTS